jgi:hypothetical protein
MTESGGAKAEVSFRGRRLGNVDGLVPRLNALEDETITNFRSERRAQQLRNLAANGWQVKVSQRGSAPQDLIRLVSRRETATSCIRWSLRCGALFLQCAVPSPQAPYSKSHD